MNKQVKVETVEASQGLNLSVYGGVAFVHPHRSRLSADQLADTARAWELVELGATAAASAILGHIERDLGVTQEDHIAAVMAGEPSLAGLRRQLQDAAKAGELQRAQVLAEAMSLPEMNEATLLSLHQADAARARIYQAHKVGDYHAMKVAQADVRRYHDRAAKLRREQLDAAWSVRAENETVHLATRRGERLDYVQVTAQDGPIGLVPATALRISSRDGLATLFESGSLTVIQYKAGRAYRPLYERAGEGLRIANMEGGGARRSPGEGFNPRRTPRELSRASDMRQLSAVDTAVCPTGAGPNRALIVLRWVAGDGRTLSSLTSGGNAKRANLAALRAALDVAAKVLSEGGCESGTT
jgi:hypothetical protein